jgi:hypothetical protein
MPSPGPDFVYLKIVSAFLIFFLDSSFLFHLLSFLTHEALTAAPDQYFLAHPDFPIVSGSVKAPGRTRPLSKGGQALPLGAP